MTGHIAQPTRDYDKYKLSHSLPFGSVLFDPFLLYS
jgi:hypothetical protein